jgi:hypothetical protein
MTGRPIPDVYDPSLIAGKLSKSNIAPVLHLPLTAEYISLQRKRRRKREGQEGRRKLGRKAVPFTTSTWWLCNSPWC